MIITSSRSKDDVLNIYSGMLALSTMDFTKSWRRAPPVTGFWAGDMAGRWAVGPPGGVSEYLRKCLSRVSAQTQQNEMFARWPFEKNFHLGLKNKIAKNCKRIAQVEPCTLRYGNLHYSERIWLIQAYSKP